MLIHLNAEDLEQLLRKVLSPDARYEIGFPDKTYLLEDGVAQPVGYDLKP